MTHSEQPPLQLPETRRRWIPWRKIAFYVGLIAWIGGIIPPSIVGWGVGNTCRLMFSVLASYQLITLIRDARRQRKRMTAEAAQGSKRTVYAVPGRFGLGTMMLVTVAFAFLFAAFNWLDVSPIACVIITSFLVLVGALQMVFDSIPRTASAAIGGVFYPLSLFVALLIYTPTMIMSLRFAGPLDLAYIVLSHVVIGELLGYVAGVLVAGVFLVEDQLAYRVFQTGRERR